MQIKMSFRHMEKSERLAQYAEAKLAKLEDFAEGPLHCDVTFDGGEPEPKLAVDVRDARGVHCHVDVTGRLLPKLVDDAVDKLTRALRKEHGRLKPKNETIRGRTDDSEVEDS